VFWNLFPSQIIPSHDLTLGEHQRKICTLGGIFSFHIADGWRHSPTVNNNTHRFGRVNPIRFKIQLIIIVIEGNTTSHAHSFLPLARHLISGSSSERHPDEGTTPRVLISGIPATTQEQDGHSKSKKPKII
jgi:hypothetical protein